jgi:Protein of unknown function (DUF2809)
MVGVSTHRRRYLIVIALTVVAGLASRVQQIPWPGVVRTNGGDVLSATCIYFGVRFVAARRSLGHSAIVAFGICVAIEVQQLYQARWAVRLRDHWIVGTFLGHGFLWIDIVRYGFGVLLGVGISLLLRQQTAKQQHPEHEDVRRA